MYSCAGLLHGTQVVAMYVVTGGQKPGGGQLRSSPKENSTPQRPRSSVRRVGGGYAHSPSPIGTACLTAMAGASAPADVQEPNCMPPASPPSTHQVVRAFDSLSVHSAQPAPQQEAHAAGTRNAEKQPGEALEAAVQGAMDPAPRVLELGADDLHELVLGSPSTRASTPQSRTQVMPPSRNHLQRLPFKAMDI
jgi:hypothetical protein